MRKEKTCCGIIRSEAYYICESQNDVKMYGTQTALVVVMQFVEFENDVKMYGTQTT